jgi:hypothetical protein
MLKLTSLAIGLLTVIAMTPTSEAIAANTPAVSISQPAANLHSQVILKIGDRDRYRGYSRGGSIQRRRELELQREREAQRRRDRYRGRRDRSYGEYRRDR